MTRIGALSNDTCIKATAAKITRIVLLSLTEARDRGHKTVDEFLVLNHIFLHQPCTPSEIATALDIPVPRVSRYISKYDRLGVVRISDSKCDDRKKLISFTTQADQYTADWAAALLAELEI